MKVIRIILILLMCSILIIGYNTIRGEHITFQSIVSSINTRVVMSSLKHNNFEYAYDYFDENNISSKQYEAFKTLLKDEKIVIQKIKEIHFRTDDGFTQGFVMFDVQGDHAKQEVVVVINTRYTKLYVVDIKLTHFLDGDVTFAKEFMERLRPLIITSNPG